VDNETLAEKIERRATVDEKPEPAAPTVESLQAEVAELKTLVAQLVAGQAEEA